jgi:hypothetical protein
MVANLGLSLLFTQQNLIKTTEAGLKSNDRVVGEYISSETDLLKADASTAAQRINSVFAPGLGRALDEQSPLMQLQQGLLLSEVLFFLLGVAIAIVASKRIVRHILEKSRRNEELAELKATETFERELAEAPASASPAAPAAPPASAAPPAPGTEDALQAVMQTAIQAAIWSARQHAAQWQADRQQDARQQDARQTAPRQAGQPSFPLVELNALGIDTKGSLERFGGCVEDYVEVLRLYAVETRSLIAWLSEFETRTPEAQAPKARVLETRTPKAPQAVPCESRTHDLHDYSITVHGIKGSSRGIGAEGLACVAERLERAARNHDYPLVRVQSEIFLGQADALVSGMERILSTFEPLESPDDRPSREKPDAAALGRLRCAAADFSIDGVEDALDELESYDYRAEGELVDWLRERCDGLAFNEIVVCLSDYVETRGGDDEYQEAS